MSEDALMTLDAFKTAREYWLEKLSGELTEVRLPLDYPSTSVYEPLDHSFTFDNDLTGRLARLTGGNDLAMYTLLLAGFKLLISGCTGQQDIVVTSPVYNPQSREYNHYVPLRDVITPTCTFKEFLMAVKQTVTDGYRNEHYSITQLIDLLGIKNRISLTRFILVLENIHRDMAPAEETGEAFGNDILLAVSSSNGQVQGHVTYNSRLFSRDTIQRLLDGYIVVLNQVTADVNLPISRIRRMKEAEQEQLLLDFNNTRKVYPLGDRTLQHLFELQADQHSDKTAVRSTIELKNIYDQLKPEIIDIEISYEDLNQRANRLARLLRASGVRANTATALMTRHPLETAVGIWGILKAGGAYLPIEPGYPGKMKRFIMEDSRARWVVTDENTAGEVEELLESLEPAAPVTVVIIEDETLSDHSPGNLETTANMSDLAYIIYTSGTTGRPKGVPVAHEGVVNYTLWRLEAYQYTDADVTLQPLSYSFDGFGSNFYSSFFSGGQLVMVPDTHKMDFQYIVKAVKEYSVTNISLVPGMYNALLDNCETEDLRCLRFIVLAGEKSSVNLIEKSRDKVPHVKLYNEYGPTEAAITAAAHLELAEENTAVIGKPIANKQIHILDPSLEPVPIKVPGECCIGGTGLTSGYLNNPELTAERFIRFYRSYRSYRSYILYRTGDLARWLPDGIIEFLGRLDHQVKIRGYRIELQEIDARLAKLDEIEVSVVIDRTDESGNRYLCAYIVPKPPLTADRLNVSQLRDSLTRELPDYMIPSYFVALNRLPLTVNGKIDRAALPNLEGDLLEEKVEYVPPATAVQRKLVEIWQRVLARDLIGIHDNFFMTGGDSIKAIQIASRMNKAGYKVEMRDIFQYPTVSQLAPWVKQLTQTVDQAAVTGAVPLTAVQHWFFESRFQDPHHFNQAVLLYSGEGFDVEALRAVFIKIQEHHDALRMTFRREGDGVTQTNQNLEIPLSLREYDLRAPGPAADAMEMMEQKIHEIQRSIDLEKGPLMRLGLFHLADGDRLLIVVHHLVIDGISWRILFEDIESLYRQYREHKGQKPLELPRKTDSFKKWAERINQYANSEILLKEKEWWRQWESQAVPQLQRDFEVNESRVRDTVSLSFHLSETETASLLTGVNHAFGTEINDILLTGLGLAFQQTFGRDRLLIALEGHGRETLFEDLDISRTVGWFTSTYPVLLDFSYTRAHAGNPARQIKEVKETLRRIPDKGIGYGILKYLTAPEHKTDLDFPLHPQVIFNYLGQFNGGAAEGHLSFGHAKESVGDLISGNARRLYDLEVSGIAADNRLLMTVKYSKKQYKEETIRELWTLYRKELERLIAFCASRQERILTPSDLTYKGISLETLEQLQQQHPIEDIYPLTPMQEGMLFHYLYETGKTDRTAYFQQISYRFCGELDVPLIRRTLDRLFKRHVALRSAFIYEGFEQPLQLVLKERTVEFSYQDIREKVPAARQQEYLEAFREKDRLRSFDLNRDVLMRVSVVQLSEKEYQFTWSHHHILMDGWCTGILVADYFEIYNSYLKNRQCRLPEATPLREYIQWLGKQDREAAGHYWTRYLEGYEGLAGIPGSGVLGEDRSGYDARLVVLGLGTALSAAVNQLAAQYQVTVNTVMQTAWGLILAQYSGKTDVVFGSVVSGRPPEIKGIESMVGLFVNTIPVRIRFETGTTLNRLFLEVQEAAIASEPHHHYPLPEIQSESGLKRNLLDHIMAFENYPIADRIAGTEENGQISHLQVYEQTNYDLNVIVSPRGEELTLKLNYNGSRCDPVLMEQIAHRFRRLLEQLVQESEIPLQQPDLLSEEEKQQLLYQFNNTAEDYPGEKVLHRWFEQQEEKTPHHIAVIEEHQELTYRELNRGANQLARHLRLKGVTTGTVVGVMLESSIGFVTSLLAVLKAGGAYLPIDPGYPAERVLSILNDNQVTLLLTHSGLLDNFSYTALQGLAEIDIEPLLAPVRQSCDFDRLPMPDRSLVDYRKYNQYIGHAMVKNSISMLGSRGCPFNCAYCHRIWPKKHVFRSAENLFSEVKFYYELGVRRFDLIDDIFNFNSQNSSRFFQYIIDHKMDVQLFFPNGMRGDILTREYIDLMMEAGTVNLDLALETASPRLQELIGKRLDIDKFWENVEYICREYPHVVLDLNVMYGFPTETEEEALMSLDFIKSIHWLHFPYVFILKIHPATPMGKLALANGISAEAIARSMNDSYHDFPETLPFSQRFARQYRARFMSEYFLSKERLLHVLPRQMKIVTEDELVKKYDNYLPMKVRRFTDILKAAGISREELGDAAFSQEDYNFPADFHWRVKQHFRGKAKPKDPDAMRVLLLDLSELFSTQQQSILHGEMVVPSGIMSLMTYLNETFASLIDGKIAKSRVDFDSYEELKTLINGFKPHLIGIRTLSYYKDFFHKTVSRIKQWAGDVPIIAGGPYATMDYKILLHDPGVDLAVLGEGEYTMAELVEKMMANSKRLPAEDVLSTIPGTAFIRDRDKSQLKRLSRAVVPVDTISPSLRHNSENNLEPINQPADLLYLISTSGSTGKPKSVMLEHRNLANLLNFELSKTAANFSRVLQFASVGFDVSAQEIFSTLLSGGTLHLIDRDIKGDMIQLMEFIDGRRLNTVFLPPALLKLIFSEPGYARLFPKGVEHIIAAGEQLVIPPLFKDYLKRYHVFLHNHYGPSETHVVTALTIDPGGAIPRFPTIGTPISNTRIYIMDEYLRLKPVGAVGELYIAGANVGRGYYHQETLTHEKFTADPFVEGERMYCTGDLARWLPDGTIAFIGRADAQVKVRGFRIELGEIEVALGELPGIKEAVVADRKEEGADTWLCAYIVTHHPVDVTELRERLSLRLPAYMIPAHFVPLDRIPLTANGKINRRALPVPGMRETQQYHPPRHEVEKQLAGIWADVLGLESSLVSIDDNFFECGGHSLKATILVSRLHKAFNVQLKLTDIFTTPTLRGLAALIADKRPVGNLYAAIPPAEKREYYALSSAQKRLYILHQMDTAAVGYNMPQGVILEGHLLKEQLEQAFINLIRRHESLRTSFHMMDRQPVQKVHDEVEFTLSEPGNQNRDVPGEFIQPFDLSRAPLLRVGLVTLEEERHLLMVDMHHIITDGVSHNVLIRDFSALLQGELLPPLHLHYKDYAQWQQQVAQQETIARQEAYWLKQFEGEPPVLNLPTDYPRPAVQSLEGNHLGAEIGPAETAALKTLSPEKGTSLFMVLLAVVHVMLSKLSGQEDIIVGTPVANRRHADLEQIIGMFVNTLALRNRPTTGKTFLQFLEEVKEKTLKAFENQDYPYEEVVEKVVVTRDMSREPLFNVMFSLQNMGFTEVNIPGVKLKPYPFEHHISKFDLSITTLEVGETLQVNFRYSTRLFKEETIHRFIVYFKEIIGALTGNPSQTIGDVEIISEEEKRKILNDFNNTAAWYPANKTIYQLFEEQAGRTPDTIAIVDAAPHSALTYKGLNEKSGGLAYLLREKGVEPETIVGIMVGPSAAMATGILGILEAGGAYLPMDLEYPEERIKYMLKDSGTAFLVHDGSREIVGHVSNIIDMNDPLIYGVDRWNAGSPVTAAHAAYIIYTSGTTGRPKGVVNEHRGAVNTLLCRREEYNMGPDDSSLQLFSYTFDGFITSFFTPVISGARVILPGKGGQKDISRIKEAIVTGKVTHFISVPALFQALIGTLGRDEAALLKVVTLAGDKLLPRLLEDTTAKGENIEIAHEYGVTEAAVMSTICRHQQKKKEITIGKPAWNTNIYIMDKYMRLLPGGIPGELCISGRGVARGYLNNPELTAEKFVPSSLLRIFASSHLRFSLYRTGDLARWLPDGTIEFLGRMDYQVKIRGFRIELGEIENRLLQHPAVKEAVVVDKKSGTNDKYLCAYIVSDFIGNMNSSLEPELREYLSFTLPSYMVPTSFVLVEQIPLTPSGKVDRRALPAPETATGKADTAPRDELEEKLTEMWKELLKDDKPGSTIGIDDNFFRIGGHSLKATILCTRIQRDLGVKIPLVEIFKAPTIRQLAQYIRKNAKGKYIAVPEVEEKEYYPVSSVQRRLYVLQQMDLNSTAYNIPRFSVLEGKQDKDALEKAFQKLIQRHQSLRTSFHMMDNDPVQKIHRDAAFEIQYYNSANLFIKPFDLSQAPLLRVGLMKSETERYLLMVDMHHIISDGISHHLLVRDFMAFLEGETLPPLRLQYRDYAEWEYRQRQDPGYTASRNTYWLNQFQDDVPLLELPYDFPRPTVQTFEGRTLMFELREVETRALKTMALNHEATLYMVLLSLCNILFSKLSRQEDVVIGTPVANRNHPDLLQIIGMFVNTLALRNYPIGSKTFTSFLKEVRDRTLEAFEYQDYPFEELVEKLGDRVTRDISRNPLFDVMFGLQRAEQTASESPQTSQKQQEGYDHQSNSSKFDMNWQVTDAGETLLVRVQYRTSLFQEETARRFMDYFKTIVRASLKTPNCRISNIEIISKEEKKWILETLNNTHSDYPMEKTVHQLFEEQVERTPQAVSVVREGEQTITYRHLNEKSNQLARLLQTKGTAADSIVGVKAEPSIEMIIALLAVLKAGGAYLPINPDQPQERIDYMLADSGANVLVREVSGDIEVIDLIKIIGPIGPIGPIFKKLPAHPAHLCYVIYTSGTTGQSKGVILTHKNLVNYLGWFIATAGVTPEDRTVLSSSFGFDLGYTVIYSSLLSGAQLHVIPREIYLSAEDFIHYLSAHRITYVKFTPSLFGILAESPYFSAEKFQHLRLMLLGGEAIKLKDAAVLHRHCPHVQVMNHYGPTETTIGSAARFIDFDRFAEYQSHPTIGTPIANTGVYILDRYLKLQPAGIPGEICISGDGTARGYLNNPELTAEKFISPQIVFNRSYRSYRTYTYYRTGDLARWLSDGNIEFLGRIDNQVKIRGYRIELEEITQQLLTHPRVEEAAVITRRRTTGDEYDLCAYVVPSNERLKSTGNLLAAREFKLPVSRLSALHQVEAAVRRHPDQYETPWQEANHLAAVINRQYDDRYRLSKEEKTRYNRQMLLDSWGTASQEKLKGTTVFVAGAGGGASPTITQLALAGFGTIIVCDYDEVELSNLNRQFLHDPSRIGMKKALSAQMTINRLNPNVNVIPCTEKITRENVFDLVGDASVIFDMLDDLEGKFILSQYAVIKQIPHIISAMADINSYAAIFHYPHTPCFHCLYDKEKFEGITRVIDSTEDYEKNPLHVVASSLFTATGFAVTEAIKIVLGFENPAYNKFFLFNQKGSEGISRTDGYNMMVYPFSRHFREISARQGFDWDNGWRGNFVEQLDIMPDPLCPLCGEANREGLKQRTAKKTPGTVPPMDTPQHKQTTAVLLADDERWARVFLAALKAGKTTVPLDPDAPNEHLYHMLEDSEARLIITSGEHLALAQQLRDKVNKAVPIINLDTPEPPVTDEVDEKDQSGSADTFTAALFYDSPRTSISTEGDEPDFNTSAAAILNALLELKGDPLPCMPGRKQAPPSDSLSQLREYLLEKMPEYMVPSHIVLLEKMPLTPNGKIDKKALPGPDSELGTDGYQAPRSLKEERLAEIWAEVLGLDKENISIDANFFELGGHSIKATRLLSRVHKEFNAKLPLADIFRSPTIRQLVDCIEKAAAHRFASIQPAEKREFYHLSSAQRRFYFLQQMEPASTAYNVSRFVILEGKPNRQQLRETFIKLIHRHESLRTTFCMMGTTPVQRVHDEVALEIEYYDFESAHVEVEAAIKEFIRAFDLSQAPLLRVGLAKIQENQYLLMTDLHHIISDGVSHRILTQDFTVLSRGQELPQLRLQYKDYSQWQNSAAGQETLQQQEAFWLRQYEEEVPVLELPTDFPRPALQSYEGSVYTFEIDESETAALKQLALAEGGTLFTMLMTLYNILLARLSGLEDIVVGTLLAGRRHSDLEQIIGAFLKTLALRNYPKGNKGFREFLKETSRCILEAFENQDYHFEDLVDKVVKRRDTGRHPLHSVMLILQNFAEMAQSQPEQQDIQGSAMGDLVLKPYRHETRTATNDMTWYAGETGDKLVVAVRYCTRLFKVSTIERFGGYFKKITAAVLEDPDQPLFAIDILSDQEKQFLLEAFNSTDATYPHEKTIHQVFAEQAEKAPDRVALIGIGNITYRQLAHGSDQLAFLLKEKGVGTDVITAIMLKRSIEMVIGILAILKAGGAYLPIDPDYPEERIKYMLTDSNARVLVSDVSRDIEGIDLIKIIGPIGPIGPILKKLPAHPAHLCYVIYTSGSTGKPKGVMIRHGSLVNRLHWMQKQYPIGAGDTLIQKTTFTFDVSLWELFWWCFGGARLCIPFSGAEKDPEMLIRAIETHRVTVIHFVPSMLDHFLEHVEMREKSSRLKSLRQVITSGEELKKVHYKRFHRLLHLENSTRLANLYGPTEATVDVSYFDCFEDKEPQRVPIGKPIANTRLYILDRYRCIVPVGVPGELCIAGIGLAQGYLNNPELTAEKFISPQIGFNRSYRSYILYRTGDLARWLPDGNIQFLGRMDHQVKIRGFRIEPGEIENRLLQHPAVKEAVVVDKETKPGDKYLCAYIVGREALDAATLREFLAKQLPGYMVPAHVVPLERLPLTPSGKIDKRALPEPGLKAAKPMAAPGNEIEEKLVEIWAAILRTDPTGIGVDANFFEMGGHSLGVITLAAEIYKIFNVEITVIQFFKIPRIREIAAYITARQRGEEVPSTQDDSVVLLNKNTTQNLFLFPPIIGYGVGYKGLAKHINSHSLYAFNYIEEDNPLRQYADKIVSIQPKGPYRLFGYSAGGNLAFEVALELEKQGCQVSDIIIMDAICKDMVFVRDSGEENNQFQQAVGDAMETMGAGFLKDRVVEKSKKYSQYYRQLIHKETTNGAIHLITGVDRKEREALISTEQTGRKDGWKFPSWEKQTRQTCTVYNGFGIHTEMFTPANTEKNAEIIKKILNNLNS